MFDIFSTHDMGSSESSTTKNFEIEMTGTGIAKAVGIVAAGVAFVVWGIFNIMQSSAETEEENNKRKDNEKTRRIGYMYRDDFEKSPKSYFHGFRGKK